MTRSQAPQGRGYDFDAIRASYPLLDQVQKHVQLKKAGREWIGLCPFHDERSPSFMVNEAKGKYHCHGCSASGDVIDFVAAIQGSSLSEAIESLTGGKVAIMSEPVRRERDALRREREEAEAARKEDGTRQAQRRWDKASPLLGSNPYLLRKGVQDIAEELLLCRLEGDKLLIPMNDAAGDIQSVQTITPEGEKKFQIGAPSGGGRLNIGLYLGRVLVCEGFATGLSLAMAQADQVCVTFSAGNMEKVARDLVQSSPGTVIVLAPDKDQLAHFASVAEDLDCPVICPDVDGAKADFNDQMVAHGIDHLRATIDAGIKEFAATKERLRREIERESEPLDLWHKTAVPPFNPSFLPDIIGRFAETRAKMIGCDPSGIAMAALAACSAVITDRIKLRMKKHDSWSEEARLWVMLVGDPSRKKTPIMRVATKRLADIDARMIADYNRKLQDWTENGKDGPPPSPQRLRISDITMEAAAEVCAHSPDGVLALQDELSGWFGSIDKYAGSKGGSKDRGFWLQTFNGGSYAIDRVGRRASYVENLSISMIGGVQPDPIRRIMAEANDDGLIQRFFPVMLADPSLGSDEEMPDVAAEYDALIDALHAMEPQQSIVGDIPLVFDDDAQLIRNQLEAQHLEMTMTFEGFNRKVASHIGKYDGLFGRICIIFHCIENAGPEPLPAVVSAATAKRASRFLHGFLRRHAMAFYTNVLGVTGDHDILTDVAGYILANGLDKVSLRTLARGTRAMRKMTRFEGHSIFEQLVAHGWLEEASMRADATSWVVNPAVHQLFTDRAEVEKKRRMDARERLMEMLDK